MTSERKKISPLNFKHELIPNIANKIPVRLRFSGYAQDLNLMIKIAVRGTNLTKEELLSGSPPTFQEFLRYIR